jgi:hypothetical protein
MLKRADASGDEDAAAVAVTDDSLMTILAGVSGVSIGVETAALLDLGSFFNCLDATSSETVAVTAGVVVGVGVGVESTEAAADEVLDVLTILFDYTHISSVFLSSF